MPREDVDSRRYAGEEGVVIHYDVCERVRNRQRKKQESRLGKASSSVSILFFLILPVGHQAT